MLREYFGRSPAVVEDTFGKPLSIKQADSQSPPESATMEEKEKFYRATEKKTYVYSTVDRELVFYFNLNDEVYAITYVGKTVLPPDPPTPDPDKCADPASPATPSS